MSNQWNEPPPIPERDETHGNMNRDDSKIDKGASSAPPDLIDDDEFEETPFPMDHLPGAAGEMARAIAQVTTAQNEPLAAASILGVISAALGAGLVVSCGGEWKTRGNLFILVIAASGTGKDENLVLAFAPLADLEKVDIENFDTNILPHLSADLEVAEERAKILKKQATKQTDPDARRPTLEEFKQAKEEIASIKQKMAAIPRIRVGDITREALVIAISSQPGEALASISSEARGAFAIIRGRYGKEGGDEDVYCQMYSGGTVSVDRVNRDRVTLRHPCLAVLWMVQPDAAREALGKDSFTESGLMPRFLFFDAKAEPLERETHPKPIAESIKKKWAELITTLCRTYRENGDNPQLIDVDPEATAIMTDYQNECIRLRQRAGDLNDLAPYVARWAENAWRIAVVLHAARHIDSAHEKPLGGDAAAAAVEIMRWFARGQLEVLGAIRMAKLEKRLLALLALLAERREGISVRDLRRQYRFEAEVIEALAREFPLKIRIVEKTPDGGLGRKSRTVQAI